jgi:hypothetical protein
MRSTVWAISAILCGIAPALPGADGAGNYAIWGPGRTSCNQFSKAAADPEKYRVYLMGYLTALNTLGEDTYNATGNAKMQDLLAWLEDYCELHKMESFDRAVQQMVTAKHEDRLRGPPGRARGWGARGRQPAER